MSSLGPASESIQYPALFSSADRTAASSQSRFFLLKAIELVSLALGAALGLLGSREFGGAAGVAAVVCFVVAVGVRISGAGQRAEKRWYDARAAAESVKSLAWQYAVGGEAFRISDLAPEASLVRRLQEILRAFPGLNFPAATAESAGATDSMQALRSCDQDERCRAYRESRVENQVSWYASKADRNKVMSARWSVAVVIVELAAVILGIMRAAGSIEVDLLGLLGAVAAGLIAWTQAKNYTELSESYSLTSHEVGLVSQAVRGGVSEEEWAQSVHDAEAAFSREHTMWLARRQSRQG